MKTKLNNNGSVTAPCPDCGGAVTTFEMKGQILLNQGAQYKNTHYQRTGYLLNQCANCGRGGLAKIYDNGNMVGAVLDSFFPFPADMLNLPQSVPVELQNEFREAERCASFGANRGASALFRSTLEKTLKLNGYTKTNDTTLKDLQKRIDAAAADGIITDARRKRAHEDIRSLGNDVLHDDWREVTDDEVDSAHRYCQRILEDFYDDRPTVEALLVAKKKLPPPAAPSTP
jgi:hypothetical protein